MYDDTSYEYEQRPRKNPMTTAAIVFGILSLLSSMIIYISLPCGALAVILAILSRTSSPMAKKAKAGLICGFCGMVATVVITVSTFYYVLTDSGLRSVLEYYCQAYLGDYDFNLEEELADIFPFIDRFETPAPEETPIIEPKGEGTFL